MSQKPFLFIKIQPSLLGLVSLLDELDVLDHSSLPIVPQLVLDALLPHEAFPVELALPDRVDLSASVVDGSHDVVQVLVGDMGLSALELFYVLFCLHALCGFIGVLLLD
jgi:hypothetical protein